MDHRKLILAAASVLYASSVYPQNPETAPGIQPHHKRFEDRMRDSTQNSGDPRKGGKPEKPDAFPMLHLLKIPPDQLDEKMQKWPRFQQMSPEEQRRMKERFTKFRGEMEERAEAHAKERGLTIAPERRQDYFLDYIGARQRIEDTLRKEFEPRRKELEDMEFQKLSEKYAN